MYDAGKTDIVNVCEVGRVGPWDISCLVIGLALW